MVNKTDNELEQAMLNILEGLEQTSRDMKEKRDKKFWANIEVPFTLLEGLSRYTKDELDRIRKYLDLKNTSSLRKAELITRIEEALPYYLETVCLELDEERFGMLIKMARNGGFISAPNIEAEQISYLRANGVVYSGTINGKRVLALPTEFINPILALAKDTKTIATVSKNTEWIKLTHGLLYYYGTLDMYQLSDLLETYTNETLHLREYLHVMHIANSYRKEHDADAVGWSNIRVLDPKQVKQEHKKRKNLSFYPFTKEQLLQAGEPEFVDRNESYQSLVQFILDHYAISREDADSLVEECVYATRIGDGPGDVLGFLEETLEFDSLETVQALMDQVVNLMNNTRQWFLKGYAPNELSEQKQEIPQALPKVVNLQIVRNVEKVGRNDPCPCGSGKKYKKCCGR